MTAALAKYDRLSNDELIKCLRNITASLTDKYDEFVQDFNEALSGQTYGLEDFYKRRFQDPRLLPSLVMPWMRLFRKLNIKSVAEYDALLRERRQGSLEVKMITEDLVEAESEWENFLKNKVDHHINEHLGSSIPGRIRAENIHVTQIDSFQARPLDVYLSRAPYTLLVLLSYWGSPYCGKHVQEIEKFLSAFNDDKKCAVILVCRGKAETGREWRSLTNCHHFNILADEDGEFVDAFKFPRSVWSSCRIPYVKGLAAFGLQSQGDRVVLSDSIHDIHQMGGDVILSSDGTIQFLYQSGTTADHPPVGRLLAAIPAYVNPKKDPQPKKFFSFRKKK